jgi:hypothetical protein
MFTNLDDSFYSFASSNPAYATADKENQPGTIESLLNNEKLVHVGAPSF